MRRSSRISVFGLAVLLCAVLISSAGAHETYTASKGAYKTNCAKCHGNFNATAYISLVDGKPWRSSLHTIHSKNMLNGDCNTCHTGFNKNPVILGSSNGGNGLDPVGCLGCHGRAEDNTGVGTPGAGLRQHHFRAGETSCLECHKDSDPANYTPVSEKVLPPYYVTPDTAHPGKPVDSCNLAGKENFVGSPIGLDNDGDGLFDGNDSDCWVPCIDNDGDGYGSNGSPKCLNGTATDCNDSNPLINPGAQEVCSDGIDNDCDSTVDALDTNCSPDLSVASVGNTPAGAKRGKSFMIKDTVRNDGTSAGTSTTGYYLSKNKVKDPVDIPMKGNRTVPMLNTGAISDGSKAVRVIVPKNAKPGIYYIIVCADDLNEVSEANEDNNCKPAKKRIKVLK